jgi:hypothetical protein
MRAHVGRVAVGAAEVHRHAALGVGGQNEQQLLQVRPHVFAKTVDDRRRSATAHTTATRLAVLPA